METHLEKRQEERFALEVPVTLENGSGTTRDISSSGIYFITDQLLHPGRPVRFSVKLDYVTPGRPVKFDCEGQVLRVEAAGDKLGIAASISEFWCGH